MGKNNEPLKSETSETPEEPQKSTEPEQPEAPAEDPLRTQYREARRRFVANSVGSIAGGIMLYLGFSTAVSLARNVDLWPIPVIIVAAGAHGAADGVINAPASWQGMRAWRKVLQESRAGQATLAGEQPPEAPAPETEGGNPDGNTDASTQTPDQLPQTASGEAILPPQEPGADGQDR